MSDSTGYAKTLEAWNLPCFATLAIAALFNPLRRRFQRLVDRRFNRSRYNAELALNAFSEKLRAQGDLASLGDEIAGVVERTMQPASLALWVR